MPPTKRTRGGAKKSTRPGNRRGPVWTWSFEPNARGARSSRTGRAPKEVPLREDARKKMLDTEVIVAKANEEYDSIVNSPKPNESTPFSLKHSKWKLHCADYWKHFDPLLDVNELLFLGYNGSAQAEGSDLVVADPSIDRIKPFEPDEIPTYGGILTLLQIGSFDLDGFEVPRTLDPSKLHEVKAVSDSTGAAYKTKIQFFSDDYLKLRVSKALLGQKFDLPKSAPQVFEFIGIRHRPETKYDRSKSLSRSAASQAD